MSAWGSTGQGADSALFESFLKDWYMSKWIDLVNNQTTTYKLFRRKTVPFKGKRMVIALRTGRSGAVGAIAPSGLNTSSSGASTTITPGYQQTSNAFVKPKIIQAGIAIPQDTIDISEGDRAAFFDVVDLEMQGIKIDVGQYLDLMCYRGGREIASIIAENSDGQGDNYLQVDNFYGLDVGKRVEVWVDNGATAKPTHPAAGYYTISGKERAAAPAGEHVIVTTETPGVGDVVPPDLLYHAGARGSSASITTQIGLEFLGLEEIVSDANLTLYNLTGSKNYMEIDRTGNLQWQSTVIDAGGAITFDDMQHMLDRITDESGGSPTVCLTHRDTRRAYAKKCLFTNASESGVSNVRFNDSWKSSGGLVHQMEDTEGGMSDWMMFDGRIPIMVDRYATHDFTSGAQKGTMYFIDTRHMYYALVTDWQWWAPEGKILREAQNNHFGVQAHAYMFGELVCDSPNTCGKLNNITI